MIVLLKNRIKALLLITLVLLRT